MPYLTTFDLVRNKTSKLIVPRCLWYLPSANLPDFQTRRKKPRISQNHWRIPAGFVRSLKVHAIFPVNDNYCLGVTGFMMKIPETVLDGISSRVKGQMGGMRGDQACLTAADPPLAGRLTHPVCVACVHVQVWTRITCLTSLFFFFFFDRASNSLIPANWQGSLREPSVSSLPTGGLHVARSNTGTGCPNSDPHACPTSAPTTEPPA